MRLPGFSSSEWQEVKAEVDAQRVPLPPNSLIGIDIDPECVEIPPLETLQIFPRTLPVEFSSQLSSVPRK
jgi:hypothetical protein